MPSGRGWKRSIVNSGTKHGADEFSRGRDMPVPGGNGHHADVVLWVHSIDKRFQMPSHVRRIPRVLDVPNTVRDRPTVDIEDIQRDGNP